jgi:hypothetical protein
MKTPNSMRCTLKDGVFFTPKKKKSLIKSKREQKNDVILPYILKVNQTGSKTLTAVQHPELSGTWAELCAWAEKGGYAGIAEQSGLRRKKTFAKPEPQLF